MALEQTFFLGGEIKTLWLESRPSSMQTHVKATVQVKITVGDRAAKKIIRTIDVNSKIDQDVLYSQETLEDPAFRGAVIGVDQIFKDDEVKKRLQ